MATEEKLICIGCPMGCLVTLTIGSNKEVVGISDNKCKQGEKYVLEEYLHPVRTLTATVLTRGSSQPLLSVKTARPIPKTKSLPGAIALAGLKVRPPVKAGDVVISNLAGTGVDVVATGNLLS